MKKITLTLFAASALVLASCGGGSNKETVEAKDAQTPAKQEESAAAATYMVSTEESEVKWRGYKVVGDEHYGTIAIKEGKVMVENGNIVGGNFVVDMNSIVDLDVENEEYNQKLVGHLKSDDFFSVSQYPTATFEIVSVKDGQITGNLTLKGTTKEITFPAEIAMGENGMKAHAEFAINRVDWNVQYGSGAVFTDLAKDKIIADEIEFVIDLKAKA